MTVSRRTAISPSLYPELVSQHESLNYAVLMPWIEGPTWSDVLVERQSLSAQNCLVLRRTFAGMLSSLEQEGLAHCDLSAGNLLLPYLVSADSAFHPIELVDVEQMYSIHFDRPEILPVGTPGYSLPGIASDEVS